MESWMTARAGEVGEWKDEYKEKGLMDMHNSVVIAGEAGGYKGFKQQWKNTVQIKLKNKELQNVWIAFTIMISGLGFLSVSRFD